MAKGKYAARSNTRRADAMAEHIDRLTDQLAEAKIKARKYEADARELPAARQELARLRQQIKDETSDELERERQARRDMQQQHADDLMAIAEILHASFVRAAARSSAFTVDELDELDRLFGKKAFNVLLNATGSVEWSREARRRPGSVSVRIRELEQLQHAGYVTGGAS